MQPCVYLYINAFHEFLNCSSSFERCSHTYLQLEQTNNQKLAINLYRPAEALWFSPSCVSLWSTCELITYIIITAI